MIVLYRPSTNQVIWHQQGPWIHQHDVEILNDHEISIFNNNAALRRSSDWSVRGTNDLVIYDFETHTTRSPFRAGFINNDIRTKTEGRGQIIGNEAFVEESNYGRLIQFSPEGKISWQFINRAKDGRVYLLNWSRIISRESGDKIRSTINQKHCHERNPPPPFDFIVHTRICLHRPRHRRGTCRHSSRDNWRPSTGNHRPDLLPN